MNYPAAIAALERMEGLGMKLGLERIEALLDALGNPHRGLRGVLVAGTNGKGSVCALVESMARAAGRSTVLLTKPHLLSWCERIAVDGRPVSEQRFADLVAEVLDARPRIAAELGPPTVFEVVTAAGVLAARDARPDVLVCEVGLGGRLDSTNVLDLGVAVVTGIALDHRQQLGDSIPGIAAEKAAIIKAGNDVVTGAGGEALAVIRRRAAEVGARTITELAPDALDGVRWSAEDRARAGVAVTFAADGLRVGSPLVGAFQARNLAVATCVARVLDRRGMRVDDAAIVRGAAAVRWPGRMQWIDGSPALLIDGGHNTEAMHALVSAARSLAAGRHLVAVFGAMADKDVVDMLAELRALGGDVVFTAPGTGRATPPAELARLWGSPAPTATTVAEALRTATAIAGPEGVVLACGSLYVAGEALEAAGATAGDGLAITV